MKETPTNQHQQILWYLINWKTFSLKELINDSLFYKAQTRLGEIESREGITIAERTQVKFINKFGNRAYYNTYTCIDEKKCIELFKLYA